MTTAFGLGCKRDLHDARDLLLAARLAPATLPLSATVWSSAARVKDQGRTSSCVGQAVSQALRLAYLHQGQQCPDLSARACYRLALSVDGADADHGTYLRSGVRGAQKLGSPTEAAWPFSARDITAQLSLAAVHSGHDQHGLRGYYRIPSGNVDGVRQALAAGFPVVAGWDVGPAFMANRGAAAVDVESESLGGHALCLHSYSDQIFSGVNSWGTAWGAGGHFTATERWVASAHDVWALDVTSGGAQ